MKKFTLYVVGLFLLISCGTGGTTNEILPDVPEGAEAVSVTGSPLYAAVASLGLIWSYSGLKSSWLVFEAKTPQKLYLIPFLKV